MYKWLLIALPLVAYAEVGSITELRGIGEVLRQGSDNLLEAELQLDIASMDNIRTGNGRLAVTFVDDSVVTLTERSSIVIDEYIFDPDPSKSHLALNMTSGTARFLTGALGRIKKDNVSIRTPVAPIALRPAPAFIAPPPMPSIRLRNDFMFCSADFVSAPTVILTSFAITWLL